MDDPGLNEVRLDAVLAELQPLRRTPAGVPVLNCILAHESRQVEAGAPRDVSVELQAVAVGEAAGLLAVAAPGMRIRATGFLAAKSLRSRAPVLHLNKIEFLEGN
ncbi:primosomal replication protein N [Pseudothauera rhizosphaerae]|uniref:Replication restart protein PriB n=1 Tax=Pseudothauera rhizosphaerae TaxID=2565932 RepID=A0A4S4AHB6_9RHOO|nr:primosomal replication protein N [Pseudothauera rhizosphaerae]THF57714.1 primosomal replication protein N [Pseudothauera rhizosphaerae]